MPTYMGRDNTLFYYITPKKVLHSYECNTFLGRNATPTIGMQHINIKFYFYLCRKLHLNNL